MHKAIVMAFATIAAGFLIAGNPASAQARKDGPSASEQRKAEISAQTRRERRRPRIYIERQPAAWDYPRPGDISWPGPGAVRQCVDWYQLEYRPSGTVLTPQMRCRWVRG